VQSPGAFAVQAALGGACCQTWQPFRTLSAATNWFINPTLVDAPGRNADEAKIAQQFRGIEDQWIEAVDDRVSFANSFKLNTSASAAACVS
jgi:hypothetical protein